MMEAEDSPLVIGGLGLLSLFSSILLVAFMAFYRAHTPTLSPLDMLSIYIGSVIGFSHSIYRVIYWDFGRRQWKDDRSYPAWSYQLLWYAAPLGIFTRFLLHIFLGDAATSIIIYGSGSFLIILFVWLFLEATFYVVYRVFHAESPH